MVMINDLSAAGLSNNEYKVYSALLDSGPSLAGVISRKTGLHRRTVYDTTEMLIKKGLVGYILKNNRRMFEASNPERLMQIVDEKRESINDVLPNLMARFATEGEKNETNFYKGKEGVKSVFEDQLNYDEVLILGASAKAYDVLQFYFKWYDKARVKKKIKVRMISTDRDMKDLPLVEVRYLPKKYANPMAVNIYGDKTAIVLWMKEPIAIVIREQEVANSYRQYFELMWHVAKA
ncbi:MAG: sugar-specific transcriptional regulator TrmB [Patescibacteria group bacterium]|jgi:sugar-specific transcriptional regulator TrmB